VAILIGHGRIERQIDGQEAVPLHITDELGIGQVVLRRLARLAQLGVSRNDDSLARRPDEVRADPAVLQLVDFARMVVLDRADRL
jgi:hypothetical protein